MIDTNELREALTRHGVRILNEDEVLEILDRLEAAEKAAAEAYRRGYATGLEEIEKERDALRAAVQHEADCVEAAKAEIVTLRVKIEMMERQEPVAWRTFDGEGGYDYRSYADNENYQLGWNARNPNYAGWVEPLYLAPGAQPAPSVPDDVMRDAERYRYLRARDDGTAGVGCWIEAEGRACDRGWLYGVQLDSAIDTCIEMLAAAPEAKP